MRSRLVLLVAAIVATMTLSPGAASAAVEFGDTCVGDEGAGPATLTTLTAPPGPLPLTAPITGVITKVKVRVGLPLPITIPEQVKVFRSAGGNNYTAVADTVLQVGTGLTEADARLPVQAGDRLGIHAMPFTYAGTAYPGYVFFCKEQAGSLLGVVLGDVPVGTTADFKEGPEARVPVAAVIEPDADNDGYGDETQDACSASPAVQVPCPLISLDTSAAVGKRAVVVYVAADSAGPVSVKGVAKLGKGRKATLKAKARTVSPGKLVPFRLKFSAKLAKRLQELEPSQKLTLTITVQATNIAGLVSTDKVKVKLKGQA